MYYRDPWGKSECVSTHSYLPNIWAGHNKRTDTAPFEDQNNFLLKTERIGKNTEINKQLDVKFWLI